MSILTEVCIHLTWYKPLLFAKGMNIQREKKERAYSERKYLFIVGSKFHSAGVASQVVKSSNISDMYLTLLLLNTTCPVIANSVDPDQLASEEAN